MFDQPTHELTQTSRPRVPVQFKLLVISLNAPQMARLSRLRRSNQFALHRAGIGWVAEADGFLLSLHSSDCRLTATARLRFNLGFILSSCRAVWPASASDTAVVSAARSWLTLQRTLLLWRFNWGFVREKPAIKFERLYIFKFDMVPKSVALWI